MTASEDEDVDVVMMTNQSRDSDSIMETESDRGEALNAKKAKTSLKRKRTNTKNADDYIKMAAAKKALNEQLKEELRLKQEEQQLRREKEADELSSTELYSNMGLDLKDAIDEMKQNPTSDIASRARESMDEVLRTAKKSKNLKGTVIKDLKNAAVLGAAALEVLRSRADNSKDNDIPGQMVSLRKELDTARNEASLAREEAAALCKELEELKIKYRKQKNYAEDSPPPAPKRRERIEQAEEEIMEIDIHEDVFSKKGEKISSPQKANGLPLSDRLFKARSRY